MPQACARLRLWGGLWQGNGMCTCLSNGSGPQHVIPEGVPRFYRGYLAVPHLPPLKCGCGKQLSAVTQIETWPTISCGHAAGFQLVLIRGRPLCAPLPGIFKRHPSNSRWWTSSCKYLMLNWASERHTGWCQCNQTAGSFWECAEKRHTMLIHSYPFGCAQLTRYSQ